MKRRAALKIVTLGALAPAGFDGLTNSRLSAFAWSPTGYKLRFFTQEENELFGQLMEMIILADDHSPGAHTAKVSLFADLMVATSGTGVKEEWRNGLRLIREEAERRSLADALTKASLHEHYPKTALERFFCSLKRMTVDGYYTSAIGIHRDLQYQGNAYLFSFPGCTKGDYQRCGDQICRILRAT